MAVLDYGKQYLLLGCKKAASQKTGSFVTWQCTLLFRNAIKKIVINQANLYARLYDVTSVVIDAVSTKLSLEYLNVNIEGSYLNMYY